MPVTDITVPASTSNLGSSFDTCGLALSLYLKLRVEPQATGFKLQLNGEGAASLPRDETNFIVQVAKAIAEKRGKPLGGANISISSQIPLARGLGSSSSAIIAGISLFEVLTDTKLTTDEIFEYAMHYEGHGDNLAPCLLGGLVLACVRDHESQPGKLIAVRTAWPDDIRIILAIPDFEMETSKMRAALPESVPLKDAIFNMQRTALLQAALATGRYDLIGEAMKDRIHQQYRAPLVPALSDVLKMNDTPESFPGLLGVAISGAGSTMIALARGGSEEIAAEMKSRIVAGGANATTLEVSVDNAGRQIKEV